jgi:hypothetical protein
MLEAWLAPSELRARVDESHDDPASCLHKARAIEWWTASGLQRVIKRTIAESVETAGAWRHSP